MRVLILIFFSFNLFAETINFVGSFHKKKDGCVYHGKNSMSIKIVVHSEKTCPKYKKLPRVNELFLCEVTQNKNNSYEGDCKESD